MTKSSSLKIALGVLAFWLATVVGASAQTVTTLATFNKSNGMGPIGALVQGMDGNFYGTTASGGSNDGGTVFRITPAGVLTTLYNFCSLPKCSDGDGPEAGLILATDGNFYGNTFGGGNGLGTIFKITPTGALTTLHVFCTGKCRDGSSPYAALLQATDGDFYGTTITGGMFKGPCRIREGCGTLFRMDASGNLTTLHTFCLEYNCADGGTPLAPLIEGSDGNLYGTTAIGGSVGLLDGTAFSLTRAGTFTLVHSFDITDGASPGGLVQGLDGNLYGTAHKLGVIRDGGDGALYQLTLEGAFTDEPFNGSDGLGPFSAMIQATDGNFYGVTEQGGTPAVHCTAGCGTIYEWNPGSTPVSVYDFCALAHCADGFLPVGSLVQGTDGNIYGTTGENCIGSSCGTVFKFSLGLPPFIATLPTSGKASTSVFILGNNLTGTTSVTFNGTPATFTVVSDTEITTAVPTGATSGTVQVTTPSGTLNSNVVFRVN